ncbi:MAG: histidine triad family protein [Verrucomicrobiota bacterium]|jgi:histidine triad (HIT) family protein
MFAAVIVQPDKFAMTIFEKIIAREIPAKIVWEDDDAIAFHDVNPQAPVHVLIVPKKAIPRLAAATESERAILGKLLLVAGELAKKLGIEQSGYRVVINSGPDAGESVPHLHVHLLGKRALAWPPG